MRHERLGALLLLVKKKQKLQETQETGGSLYSLRYSGMRDRWAAEGALGARRDITTEATNRIGLK